MQFIERKILHQILKNVFKFPCFKPQYLSVKQERSFVHAQLSIKKFNVIVVLELGYFKFYLGFMLSLKIKTKKYITKKLLEIEKY
jgi:hypothetical protein